jgi:hypothetical protein
MNAPWRLYIRSDLLLSSRHGIDQMQTTSAASREPGCAWICLCIPGGVAYPDRVFDLHLFQRLHFDSQSVLKDLIDRIDASHVSPGNVHMQVPADGNEFLIKPW